MESFYNIYVLSIIVTSAICIASAGFAYLNRNHNAGSLPFAAMMLGVSIWNLPIVPFLMATTLEGKLFWTKVE